MTEDDPIRAAREELQGGAVPRSSESATGEQPGDLIDRYKLLQQVGEGGMGTVWMAEQSAPVRRRVALKIIKLGMDTREVIARFEAERQALAMMDHPHIARVFDGGATAEGRPYFVMELVRGVPITEHCDRARLGLRERLELFQSVCGALQHAHQKGIVHRDIKPSNVLVTLHDGVAVPKVIDFGIAKATNAELTQRTLFTQFAQMIGTPEYMAPEQAELSGLDVDTRADVYSLGVLLYELVTGSKPFDMTTALEGGYAELMRTIREIDPARPSTRVSTRGRTASPVAALATVDVDELSRRLRGDLDCIVMKALEKDRQRRYATAASFSDDIQRYLADEPVEAMPPSTAYRFRKALRRHRTGFAVAAITALLLVLGIAGTTYGLVDALEARAEAEASRTRAEGARLEAELVAEFSGEMLEGVAPRAAAGRDTTLLRGLMDDAMDRIEAGDLADAPRAELRLRSTIGGVYESIGAFEAAKRTLRPALALAESLGEDDEEELVGALSHLARAHLRLNEIDEARALYGQALDLIGDPEDEAARRSAANVLSDLALLAEREGDLEEAERLGRLAVDEKRALGGGPGTQLSTTVGNLGSVLSERGDLDGAAAAFEEALQLARDGASGDTVDLVVTLGNAGHLALLQGRDQDGERLYRESLEMARRVFDGDHVLLAGPLNGTAGALLRLGRPREAVPHLEEAHAMYARLFPEGHPDLISAGIELARTLDDLGRASEAEPQIARSVTMAQQLDPPRPELVLGALECHAHTLGLLGRNGEAEARVRRAIELHERGRARTPNERRWLERAASLQLTLATTLADPEQQAERIDVLERAIDLYTEVEGGSGLGLANALDNLGVAVGGEDGEELLRRSLAMKRAELDGEHQDLATTLIHVGYAVDARGASEEALPHFEEALAIRRKTLGEEHALTGDARLAVARGLYGAGRGEEATAMLESCMDLPAEPSLRDQRRVWGASGPLLSALLSRGDLERAVEVAEQGLAACRAFETEPGPSTAVALINLGTIEYRRGRLDRGIDLLGEGAAVIEESPPGPDDPSALAALMLRGHLQQERGGVEEAVDTFERLLQLADRMEAPAPQPCLNAGTALLDHARASDDRGAIADAARRVVALVDRGLPDDVFALSGSRAELTGALLELAAADPTRRIERLDEAEAVARRCMEIREALREKNEFKWLCADASSRLGEVLLARSRAERPLDPAAADGSLAEARHRIQEAAEMMWADNWLPGQRPPTAGLAAARVVELLEYLDEIEPDADHGSALPLWRERAGG